MEKDIILLATTITHGGNFATDAQRVNVALTRAKHHLLVLGCSHVLRTCSPAFRLLLASCQMLPPGGNLPCANATSHSSHLLPISNALFGTNLLSGNAMLHGGKDSGRASSFVASTSSTGNGVSDANLSSSSNPASGAKSFFSGDHSSHKHVNSMSRISTIGKHPAGQQPSGMSCDEAVPYMRAQSHAVQHGKMALSSPLGCTGGNQNSADGPHVKQQKLASSLVPQQATIKETGQISQQDQAAVTCAVEEELSNKFLIDV